MIIFTFIVTNLDRPCDKIVITDAFQIMEHTVSVHGFLIGTICRPFIIHLFDTIVYECPDNAL